MRWVETEQYARIAAARPHALEVPLTPSIEIPESNQYERLPRQMLFAFTNTYRSPYEASTLQLNLLDASPNPFPNGPIEVRGANRTSTGHLKYVTKMQGYELGAHLGATLTDNSYEQDGERFHDAIHIAFATYVGWSPVLRSLLRVKRRSLQDVDEIEDGARALALEESVIAFLNVGIHFPHTNLGRSYIEQVATALERSVRPLTRERLHIAKERWQTALIAGSLLFNRLFYEIGVTDVQDISNYTKTAYVAADLDRKEIRTSLTRPEDAWAGELINPVASPENNSYWPKY